MFQVVYKVSALLVA